MRIKRSSILTKIVLAVVFVYALVTLVMIGERKVDARAQLEEMRLQELELASNVDSMQYAIEHKDDPDVIEDIARQNDLKYPNEKTFYAGHKN